MSLLDEAIVPLDDFDQLLSMLVLSVLAMVMALKLRSNKPALWAAMIGFSILIVVGTVFLYGRFGLLANPVYFLLALIGAWWLAIKFGPRWIIR